MMSVCKTPTDLRENVICWPTNKAQYQTIADDFEEVAGMPGVICVIDGTHIRIPGPSEHRDAYINIKGGTPSMQLQMGRVM